MVSVQQFLFVCGVNGGCVIHGACNLSCVRACVCNVLLLFVSFGRVLSLLLVSLSFSLFLFFVVAFSALVVMVVVANNL